MSMYEEFMKKNSQEVDTKNVNYRNIREMMNLILEKVSPDDDSIKLVDVEKAIQSWLKDKFLDIWQREDVEQQIRVLNDLDEDDDVELSDEKLNDIFLNLKHYYDANTGINWYEIDNAIQNAEE